MSSPVHPSRNEQTFPGPRVFRQLKVRGRKRVQDTVNAEQGQTSSETSPSKPQWPAFIDGAEAAAPFKSMSDPAKDLSCGTVDQPVTCETKALRHTKEDLRHKDKDDTVTHPRLEIKTVFPWCGQYLRLEQPPHPDATKHCSYSIWEYLAGAILDRTGCRTWIKWFISSRGNEYFCEIDEEYLTDRFNLTGLNTEVQYYQYALDLVTDVFDLDCEDDMREQIEKSARHLYGLVHARYIVTTRGLAKMVDKYKRADFGKCPRVLCDAHPLLPMGLSDISASSSSSGSASPLKSVKLFCAKCEDIYNPKSSRHAAIDGAYFGSSFHNILFQVYPALIPEKSRRRYEPRIFGFRVHAASALGRWQDGERRATKRRLATPIGECVGIEGTGVSFVEDREGGNTDSEIEEDELEGEDELGLTREGETQSHREERVR